MSLYDDASLIMYPSGYKADKIYSLKPTDGSGDFDFARASTATRVNADGLIESVATGVPRIDYTGGGCGSLLLEGQRTNLITQSEDFSNAAWTKSSATVTITSNVAPDGTTDSVYNLTGTNANLYTGGTAGIEYTISVYAKSNGQGKDNFKLRLGNNLSSSITVTDEWVRYEFTSTPTTAIFGLTVDGSPNNEWDILIWGAQLEQAPYPTSYIPTSGTTVTRLADSCSQTLPSAVPTSGVIYAEIELFDSVLNTSSTAIRYGINQTTFSSNWIFFGIESGDNLRVYIRANDSTSFDNTSNNVFPTAGVYKIAMRFAPNDTKVFVNGVQKASSSNSVIASNLNNLNICGESIAPSIVSNSVKNRDFRLYDTALTDAELQALTTI